MAKRGTLSPKIPSKELNQALNQGVALMRDLNKRVLTPEVLLLAFVKMPDVAAHRLLRQFAEERGFNWAEFEKEVEQTARNRLARDVDFDFVTDGSERISLADETLIAVDEGLTLAKARDEVWCGTEHILAAMADGQVGTSRLLNRLGITGRAVSDLLAKPGLSTEGTAWDHVALALAGRLAPVYFREALLRDLMNLLSMSQARHVVLVGPNGVGKRSLVYALAQQIATGKGPAAVRSVVEMNERALLDNALATIRAGLRLAQGGVIFVPNLARFFGGFRAEFPEKACNELQKAFFDRDVAIVGTASEGRYNDRLGSQAALTQNSQLLKVEPATVDETVEILRVLKPSFQADYELSIDLDSFPTAAQLAGRYLTSEPLPGAAVHLMHRACALVKMSGQAEGQPAAAVKGDSRLEADDVMVVASLMTGIPVTKMGAEERDRYAHMVEHLHQRIVGQDEAVVALSRAVKVARVGLRDPGRPIGSFLFLGPSGVGKTELAKALAEFLFATEQALITLDMSEYMEEASVNRLIGAPPGYVGFEGGGQLTDAIRDRPYSVVLFDEVEKASIKVFDLLLQVMEEGRLTDGQGNTVSFKECVVLMTSNIGSHYLSSPEMGETEARQRAEQALKAHFRPEFLNRLDDIIFFHLLNDDHLRQILVLMLRREEQLLAGRNLALEVSDETQTWLLARNDRPEWGARPLRRIIQKHIREPLADFLLNEDLPPGARVSVDVDTNGEQLRFQVT